MASVFTFDPDPPNVSSPWSGAATIIPPPPTGNDNPPSQPQSSNRRYSGFETSITRNEDNGHGIEEGIDDGIGVDDVPVVPAPLILGGLPAPFPSFLVAEQGHVPFKFEAEPQEGPVEYKFHLLLRPRRTFLSSSTAAAAAAIQHAPGSQQQLNSRSKTRPSSIRSAFQPRTDSATCRQSVQLTAAHEATADLSSVNSTQPLIKAGTLDEGSPSIPPTPPSPTPQARQNRLHHLTTQLLWRLQQSSSYHSNSTAKLIAPCLPEAATLVKARPTTTMLQQQSPQDPEDSGPHGLLPGLEDSKGALYEIGVADDGSVIGLAFDEMDESLVNLRAMATSLGCRVEILRTAVVGRCEWTVGPGRAVGTQSAPRCGPSPEAESGVRFLSVEHPNIESSDSSPKNGKDNAAVNCSKFSSGLWVVEAFIVPDARLPGPHSHPGGFSSPSGSGSLSEKQPDSYDNGDCRDISHKNDSRKAEGASFSRLSEAVIRDGASQTEQLRVSLVGRTTSGKSSLLGTLSTSTLDNGRGSSRLSLLKHRHEIQSGVTSSVAPEIIGYQDNNSDLNIDSSAGQEKTSAVINYGCGNISSWNDIHNAAEGGRLIFFIDSAGHPRYRRTTIRSLVSWDPHWTLCCLAADDEDGDDESAAGVTLSDGSSKGTPIGSSTPTGAMPAVLGTAGASISARSGSPSLLPAVPTNLSKTYIELCLRLNLPLVIVVTKMDRATTSTLRRTLTKVLSVVKNAGRKPSLLRPSNVDTHSSGTDLQSLSQAEIEEVRSQLLEIERDPISAVPIVLTSAVTGSGIGKLHALLRYLPLPHSSSFVVNQPQMKHSARTVFNIDEIFINLRNRVSHNAIDGSGHNEVSTTSARPEHVVILSGILRRGDLRLGEEVLIGPFASSEQAPTVKFNEDNSSKGPSIESAQLTSSVPTSLTKPSPPPRSSSAMARRKSAEVPRWQRSISTSFLAHVMDPGASNRKVVTDEVISFSDEWLPARIISIRNLRLPLWRLKQDQVGTVGVSTISRESGMSEKNTSALMSKLRKGMVLVNPAISVETSNLQGKIETDKDTLVASSTFAASFSEDDYHVMEPGALFTVYVASVRAPARVVTVGALEEHDGNEQVLSEQNKYGSDEDHDDENDIFAFEEDKMLQGKSCKELAQGIGQLSSGSSMIEVTFQFVNGAREWIEQGSRVLVTPGNAVEGGSGLDVFIGKATKIRL